MGDTKPYRFTGKYSIITKKDKSCQNLIDAFQTQDIRYSDYFMQNQIWNQMLTCIWDKWLTKIYRNEQYPFTNIIQCQKQQHKNN